MYYRVPKLEKRGARSGLPVPGLVMKKNFAPSFPYRAAHAFVQKDVKRFLAAENFLPALSLFLGPAFHYVLSISQRSPQFSQFPHRVYRDRGLPAGH